MKDLTDKQRKRIFLIICAVSIPALLIPCLLWGRPQPTPVTLRISEVMNHNRSVYAHDDGQYYDWVEIQNVSDRAVSLSGITLTDDPDQTAKYTFPDLTLDPAACVVVHLTGAKNETRTLCAPFGLDSAGDTVYLYDEDAQLDRLSVGKSPENLSFGRKDGNDVWFATPTPNAANGGIFAATTDSLRAACYTGVMISEVCAVSSNTDTDWVELHNTTDTPLSLVGYRLTENVDETGYVFGDITIDAGGYYTIACDADTPETVTPCAPFSLGRFGSSLYLYTPDGVLCDYFESGKQRLGVTSGRVGDDRAKRVFFDAPTRDAENGTAYNGYAPAPHMTQTGGYVEDSIALTLTVPSDCRVYYSTNGSVPTENSNRYEAGQSITLSKTAVLRAVAYRDGYLSSDVVTETYLNTDKHDLPVFSVSGDPAALFGANGTFTQFNNKTLSADVHAEFFDENGVKETEFDSILKISGGLSRYNPQKAFSLKLNQTTGVSEVTYPLFEDSSLTAFSDLVLRPSGSDWSNAKLRDEFCATALKNTEDLVIQAARPVALYINGTYHGLYYLREKRNEAFVAANTGIPEEYVQLAEMPALFEWDAEVNPDIDALIKYARTHNLKEQEHYDYVMSQINATSLIRYFAIQTYFGNGDMINNVACYRDTRDGKWNWILFDLDWACTSYYVNSEFIAELYYGTGPNTFQHYYYPLITALFKNDEFSTLFVKEYKRLMNTTLSSERLIPILDNLSDSIRSEIPRQYAKYGAPSPARFDNQITYMRNFLEKRETTITRQLKSVFSLTDEEWDAL